jgi:hypothetical protein
MSGTGWPTAIDTPSAARRPRRRDQPVVNRVLARILRSPLASAVDGSLLLLTVRGRRTGREITFPVQYATGVDAIWVRPGRPETTTWWRSLRTETPVRIRLRGQDLTATAKTIVESDDPAAVVQGVRAYVSTFRRTMRFGSGDNEILVRIRVPGTALERARRAAGLHRSTRFGLGVLELVVGLAAVWGAVALIRDGGGMPTEWLRNTPFDTWLVPGLALLVIIGGSQLAAAAAVLTNRRHARAASIGAGLILVGWIVVQVLVLRRFHVMQPTMFTIGCLTAALARRLPCSNERIGRSVGAEGRS